MSIPAIESRRSWTAEESNDAGRHLHEAAGFTVLAAYHHHLANGTT